MNFARSLARNYLLTGRGNEVFAGVRDRLRAADLAIGNLESILLERGPRADTTNSPVFAGPQRESLPLLLDAGFDAVGTANNHAWDFGYAGLIENLRWLDSAGLPHAGTGPTVADAWRPVILRRNGWTVALFSITAMFNYPDLTVIGHAAECCVAWLDTTVAAAAFRHARDSLGADVVIAYVHQGLVEYRGVPDDASVIFMRALARRGADAVIGHHPHVPQGVEWMGNVPIVYSLGNFVFMQRQRWTNRGLWAELVLTPGAYRPQLTVLPLVVGYTPSFATGADSLRVMRHVDSLSARLSSLPNPPRRRNVSRPRNP
jgi:poly-gamma-glutamate capsule biosynthesis protein CapA/YwtB (metallophosphatase superfamily)